MNKKISHDVNRLDNTNIRYNNQQESNIMK